MKTSFLWVSVLTISSTVFAANLESLNKDQVINAFVNKTAVSITSKLFNGQEVNESPRAFSFYMDDKGNLSGKLGAKSTNGPQTDVGNYKIDAEGRVFCTWRHWYGGKTVCFNFFNTQNAYLAVNCENVFFTGYLKSAIKEGNHLMP